jgi:hypothetical protein
MGNAAASLHVRHNIKERAVMFSAIGFILIIFLLARTLKYVRVFGEAVLVGMNTPSAQSGTISNSGGPSSESLGRYKVRIKFQKVCLPDKTTGHYSWRLLENHSGARLKREDNEALDLKVSNFCRHLAEDETIPMGELPSREEWFN